MAKVFECISYYYGHAVFQDVNWISSIRTCFGSRLVRSMPLQCPKRTLLHLLLPRKTKRRLAPPFAVERQYRRSYDGSIKHGSASGANIKPTLRLKLPSALGLRWSSNETRRGTLEIAMAQLEPIGKLASRMSEANTTTIGLVQTQRNVSFSIVQLRLPGIQLNRPGSDRAAYPQFSERNPAVLESISSSVLKYVLNKINHLFHVAPAAMMVPHLEPGLSWSLPGLPWMSDQVRPGLAAVLEMAIALESREGISKRIRDRIDIGVERTLSVEWAVLLRGWNNRQINSKRVGTKSPYAFFGAQAVTRAALLDDPITAARGTTPSVYTVANLVAKETVQEWLVQCIGRVGLMERLTTGIEQLSSILKVLHYWNSFWWNTRPLSTISLLDSVKLQSAYQSAAFIAQDVSLLPRQQNRPIRSITTSISRSLLSRNAPKRIKWLRLWCAGRFRGGAIARNEVLTVGKQTRGICRPVQLLESNVDYAAVGVATRYGMLGVKVWIAFNQHPPRS
uniref:Ribosomal protein S3 n=1 Tax=Viscum scurruloideum TaxID=1664545 RepID=A0A0H3WGV4_9MAGN|nr:ribosomal protein S3 [Viscum scurruloideum]AKL79266.1 ribosomal protein S3 [Viscum scurruloideum]